MLGKIIKKLIRGEDLTHDEAVHTMTEIMTGQAGEIRTAAILALLAAKGESGTEIEAFARSMRSAATTWDGYTGNDLADTCGTGGDSLNTINVSTLSALLLSSMGIKIAKHGNRAVSSTTGSADFLEASGVRLDMTHQEVVKCLDRVGITFLFAPQWHPAMKNAMPVRKAMGVRTVFNVLGPLTNPVPIQYQALGVFSDTLIEPVAHALAGLGRHGAYVLHAEDGLDEVSIATHTKFVRVENGKVTGEGVLVPEDFGFKTAPLSSIQVTRREESIERSSRILKGQGTDEENATVAMNASLVYSMVHRIDNLKEAAEHCHESLKSGKAWDTLRKWADFAPGSDTIISVGSDTSSDP